MQTKKLHFLIFLFLLFFLNSVYSQNKKVIDSLEIEIKKEKNLNKLIEINFMLANELVYFDDNKVEKVSKIILELTKKTNNKKGFAYYYYLKANLENIKGYFDKAFEFNKKAAILFKITKDTTKYMESGFALAVLHYLKDNPNDAIILTNDYLSFTSSKKYARQIAQLYSIRGRSYSKINNYYNAIANFNKAIQTIRKSGIKSNLIIYNCFEGISKIYVNTNQYENALSYVLKMKSLIANYEFTDYEKGNTYAYLSYIYENLKDYKNAKFYLKKSFNLCSEKKNKNLFVYNLGLEAKLNFSDKNYLKSILIGEKSLKLSNDKEYTANAQQILGKSYFAVKKYLKALQAQKKVIEYINNSGNKSEAQQNFLEIYGEIAKTEFALNKYIKAYKYQEIYKEINDKILLKEKTDRINELQTQFEVSEKEIALKNSLFEKQKKDVEIQKQKNFILVGITILFITILVALILIFFYLKNKRKNIELSDSKNKLENLLTEKDVLLKEVHHRVKNNLQMIISLLNIQSRSGKNVTTREFVERSLARITSMSLVHQNLYQNENIEKVNFDDYLNNLTQSISNTFIENKERIKVNINCEEIYLNIETAIPLGLIINELMYNMYKHAFPDSNNGEIEIEIRKTTTNYQLTIKDNGIGFNDNIDSGKSMGLKLVKLLSSQINGTFEKIKSEKTEFLILFSE